MGFCWTCPEDFASFESSTKHLTRMRCQECGCQKGTLLHRQLLGEFMLFDVRKDWVAEIYRSSVLRWLKKCGQLGCRRWSKLSLANSEIQVEFWFLEARFRWKLGSKFGKKLLYTSTNRLRACFKGGYQKLQLPGQLVFFKNHDYRLRYQNQKTRAQAFAPACHCNFWSAFKLPVIW